MKLPVMLLQKDIKVKPEIMIPLVGHVNEFILQEKIVRRVADEVLKEKGKKVSYLVGTMIELPRACVTADEIAKGAEFFSFGTNDLNTNNFWTYQEMMQVNSFLFMFRMIYCQLIHLKQLTETVLVSLLRMGTEKGRSTRPDLKVGICGEHGGEPSSVEFCHQLGLNYVSCSPFRVPIARLAAARAVDNGE